ncbi:anti-anti-sigma factor [Streptosporangium subroseum]|uniref:Anti-anti-sigma factor n=1 Tax=Streptosporangium subroseum TaxID=106412 RepID=A0A239NUY5_9ACTN|nr:STAS domain-containing protein [Streptosporangium subroseum]SNT58144.1 anti-anti-sigma factor [Streptosporangium subroseum]
MPPESANMLSISSGVHGTAIVVRATGELDYDYAPIFRREVTQIWGMGADASSPLPSGLPSPLSGPSPLSLPAEAISPLSPETSSPFSPEAPSPLSPSPFSPETPSPFSPETPSPLSPEAPSPLSPETPSPLSPEAPSPLSPEPSPQFSPEAPSLLFPETSSPLSPGTFPPQASLFLETSPGTPLQPETAPWLILDLAGLTFCDSTGLAELLWILHRSQETGTHLVLTGVTRTLRHMLDTTGLLPYFTMYASVEDALKEVEQIRTP